MFCFDFCCDFGVWVLIEFGFVFLLFNFIVLLVCVLFGVACYDCLRLCLFMYSWFCVFDVFVM